MAKGDLLHITNSYRITYVLVTDYHTWVISVKLLQILHIKYSYTYYHTPAMHLVCIMH